MTPPLTAEWDGNMSLTLTAAGQLGLVLSVCIMATLILTGSLKQYKVMIVIMLLLGLQILIVQLLFCREGFVIYQWGILRIYSEAIPLAITGILKAAIIFYASMQFFSSASPQDFTLMLIKFRIPYRFAMLVGLGVRFLPLLKANRHQSTDRLRDHRDRIRDYGAGDWTHRRYFGSYPLAS